MKNTRGTGFTLVEIMIVVAIIGLLAMIAIPNFVRARARTQTNACIENLRAISEAIDQFAIENNHSGSWPIVSADVEPYLKRGIISGLMCPAGFGYVVTRIDADPECGFGEPHTI